MPIINGSESALTLGYENVSNLPQDSEGRYIVDVVFCKAPEATKINVEFIGPENNPWEIYYLHHIDAVLQLDEGSAFASYIYGNGSERVFSTAGRGYRLIDANTEERIGYMERVDTGTHGSIKRQLMRQQAADIVEPICQSYEDEPADDFEWGNR